jgi:CheY-like chemotaxis protein/serine phosphatase RsbU (regulator of sigma subunit)
MPVPKILLVDDDDLNCALLSRALIEYQIVTSSSGREAIRLAADIVPDLILLDIGMPEIDGFEVCRQIKQMPELSQIPIIFLTSMTGPTVIDKCFKAGAVDFLSKPFSLIEIKARVKTHLGLKRTTDALNAWNVELAKTVSEQQLNITLARNILRLINRQPPRYIDLNDEVSLFVESMISPCNQEGGDHLQIKVQPGGMKTAISLKDQSGHAVNCVLRSIVTDLMHNALLVNEAEVPLAETTKLLNQSLCRSGLFQGDEFCTALMAELDHASLCLTFISAGHPPIILIRGDEVTALPDPRDGGQNLPLAFMPDVDFQPVVCQLQTGDRLLLFTDGLNQLSCMTEKQLFSHQELLAILREIVTRTPALTVSGIIDALLAEITGGLLTAAELQRHNPTADDVSLIGLEIEPRRYVDTLTLLPAAFANIDALVEAAFQEIWPVAESHQISCAADNMRMVLSEAILNAWKHGNAKDPEKPLTVAWRLGNDFCLEVTDQGSGFDFRHLPDPVSSFNLFRSHGRGLFIIGLFTDWHSWRQGGRQIAMTWRCAQSLPADPDSGIARNLQFLPNLWLREGRKS